MGPARGHKLSRLTAFLCVLVTLERVGTAQVAPPPGLFPLELRHHVELGSGPEVAPGLSQDRLVVALRDATLLCLDLGAGRVLWQQVNRRLTASPVVTPDVAVLATVGELEALGVKDGASRWKAGLSDAVTVPPVVAADEVVVALSTGELQAFSLRDGRSRPVITLPGRTVGGLELTDGSLVAGVEGGRVVAVAWPSGAARWQRRLPAEVTSLTVAAGRVYVGALDNFLYCLDLLDGRVRWRWRTGGDIVGPAVVDGRRVYFVSLDNLVRALDRTSGVQRWKRSLPSRPVAGPVLVEHTLVLGGLSPELRAVHAETGEPVGRYDLGDDLAVQPLLRPGRWLPEHLLVALTRGGTLLVLGRRVSPGLVPLGTLPGTPVDVTLSPPE